MRPIITREKITDEQIVKLDLASLINQLIDWRSDVPSMSDAIDTFEDMIYDNIYDEEEFD